MGDLVPTIVPPSGVMGLPEGIKETGRRVDLRGDDFKLLIETKGFRIAWSRAASCPCEPINTQTEQPDPNCALCHGKGWFYFAPSEPANSAVGNLEPIQERLIASNHAAVIRGLMTSGTKEFDPYNKISTWDAGQMNLTVRNENVLGYYDRIILLDFTMAYTEHLTADGTSGLSARYDIVGLNVLRSTTTVYEPSVDFDTVDGAVVWLPGKAPEADTRLAIHYTTFPVYLVHQHPHVVRGTIAKFKKPVAKLQAPQGDTVRLPIQAVVKYEFLATKEVLG